ncbi:MAG TPA: DinB family protein [Thermoanaerobaculia bacterium]|nr:DinB family protein [Thermoanaerobaculia bacterium]
MSQFANRFNDRPEDIQAYVQSLLDLVGDREPLALLSTLLTQIDELTRGLSDERLRKPEAPGKWSIANVVQHLSDAELFYAIRYRLTLAHDEPPLAGYDQDAFAARLHYDAIPFAESVAFLSATRRANLNLLRLLNVAERERAAMHAERGRETVDRLMHLHAAHDLVHLRQIERIRNS